MEYYKEKNFYEKDEKKYKLRNNPEFLKWLEISINNGYQCRFRLTAMQDLIDIITSWYEMKYPDAKLEEEKKLNYKNNTQEDNMKVEDLMKRMPTAQEQILSCPYYKSCNYIGPKSDKASNKVFKRIYYKVDEKGKIIETEDTIKYIGKREMDADELLKKIEKMYPNRYDLSNLKKDNNNFYSDIELRHRLLSLTALSILYSENTTPSYGYKRAQIFIKEFNEEMGLLLNTYEIDKIMESALNSKRQKIKTLKR